MPSSTLAPPIAWKDRLPAALKEWGEPNAAATALADTALWRQTNEQMPEGTGGLAAILGQSLATLRNRDPKAVQLLELRYCQHEKITTIATKLGYAESTTYKRRDQALEQMAQILQEMDNAARQQELDSLSQRLAPASGHALIAVDSQLQTVAPLLLSAAAPWLVCIEGIGGIGKTTLADALVRQLLQSNQAVAFAWVSARQHNFLLSGSIQTEPKPALTSEALVEALANQLLGAQLNSQSATHDQLLARLEAQLHRVPHLIVIDNLETVLDLETLVPLLRRFQNPTKFLLTSRKRLADAGDIYHFPMRELSQPDALYLIRQEATLRNLAHLKNASDAELLPIYHSVGGNPLALRLLVGQTHVHALKDILDDLATPRGASVEALYAYIYRHIWLRLDEVSKHTLLAMPLLTERGGTLAYLTQISGLAAGDLRNALQHLVTLNLVDSRGDLHERRYTIHTLTRTFLQTHVIEWKH